MKKNKIGFYLGYSLFYSSIVLVFSFLMRFLPAAVRLENDIYDNVQEMFTIDSKDDFLYSDYEKYLEELVFINIDSLLIDSETDRIKRDKLSEFLQRIYPAKDSLNCIFLDYAFYTPSSNDSSLIESMRPFYNKILLPYTLDFKNLKVSSKNPIASENIYNIKNPFFSGQHKAFVKAFSEPITGLFRFFLYRAVTDRGEIYQSIPYVIAKKFGKNKWIDQQHEEKLLDRMVNIRFILRNRDLYQKERAVMVYSMSDFIDEIPSEIITELLLKKTVFVGLFEGYHTKYDLEIDKFPTPVEAKMSGALILTNAYLNLISNNLIKQATLLSIFIFNLFVGLFIALYRKFMEKKISNPIVENAFIFVVNLFVSFGVFPAVGVLFFVFFNTKLLLGVSMLLFLQHYRLYLIFKSLLAKIKL